MYAAIVAAWAVYLVPMWLRREDELNRARQTRRYTAAIKVLSHKDAFERRWANTDEAAANAAQLPIAAGQGPVTAPPRKKTAGPGTSERERNTIAAKSRAKAGPPSNARRARTGSVAAASARLGPIVSAPINSAWTAQDEAETKAETRTDELASPRQQASQQPFAPQTPVSPTTSEPQLAAATAGARTGTGAGTGASTGAGASTQPQTTRRTGLMVRRRRMVTLLFAVSTLGALISADLGTRYIWAMITPATLLSAYIVWLRRDEQTRAAERARRTAARARADQAQARAAARRAHEQTEAAREAASAHAEAEARAEEQSRAEAHMRTQAARRRAAAARSRAQAYAPTPPTGQPHTADNPPTRRAANE
jgi:hypothetical protein